MKCLTANEQSGLLASWAVPEDPYHGATAPACYSQFYPPEKFRPLQYFILAYMELLGTDQPGLVAFTDWALYQPHEMELIDQTRRAEGETRPLIEAPGHLFGPEEKNKIVAAFSLGVGYGWSAYLYLPRHKTILYNWEGEIMDFWTDSAENLRQMEDLLSTYKLRFTEKDRTSSSG
jgi:hypothetical protein